MNPEQVEKISRWVNADPDPETAAETRRMLSDDDENALISCFGAQLEFGTAGLRGVLGPGPNRMNRATVIRATAGLCAWLVEAVPDARERGICFGRDARVKSDVFCEDAIAVARGAGFKIFAYETVAPTPLVGFAVLKTNAAAGVVITASHNPPEYNGYKVFWGNGAQIIPPHDAEIAKRIAAVFAANKVPMTRSSLTSVESLEPYRTKYVDEIQSALCSRETRVPIRIAYTALHGVGEQILRNALDCAGFHDVHSVAAQADPDGTFPTVAFPNPEEKGALDRVIDLATEVNADLVLANDPDADRLAVATKIDGRWRQLSGNELGCLLAHYILEYGKKVERGLVISTIVSSPMLTSIAKAHGVRHEQTLTGHKWIQNRAIELEREGFEFLFGYEEALGYAVSRRVRDKDGISAAIVVADAVSRFKHDGKTLFDELLTMSKRYGVFRSRQVSIQLTQPEDFADRRNRLIRLTQETPSSFEISSFDEIDGVMRFIVDRRHRVMVRPSGTEPKLKFYFDVSVDASENLDADARRAEAILDELVQFFV